MVNERVGASDWESGDELGDTWASRNAFSYGRCAHVFLFFYFFWSNAAASSAMWRFCRAVLHAGSAGNLNHPELHLSCRRDPCTVPQPEPQRSGIGRLPFKTWGLKS